MWLFLIMYIGLCLYGLKIGKESNSKYLSREQTSSVKGIFILLVFLSHFNSYVTFSGTPNWYYIHAIAFFGQTMVTMFLFYSGYGVMESIKRKGENYVNAIPKKRVLGTLIRFDCAVLCFLIIGYLLGNVYDIKKVLYSLIGWDSVGNSNWYIFVIVLLYIMTYISFKFLNKKNHIVPILGVIVLTLVWAILCYKTNIRTLMWYDTALCYAFGMLWSIYKEKIEAIMKNNVVWLLSLLGSVCFFFWLRTTQSIYSALIVNLVFVVIVVIFTMRVQVGNKILQRAGECLFEIYILQRIPMMLFKDFGLHEFNVYVYFVCCVIATLLLIKPFKYFSEKVLKAIKI